MAKVSIIVPYLNERQYIADCEESIAEQEIMEYEIIRVEDTIVDNTPGMGEHGVAWARNEGMKRATGDYVYFMDADDYLMPNTLKPMISTAVEHGAAVVTGQRVESWFRKSSFDWEKAKKETELSESGKMTSRMQAERFDKNFSATHMLIQLSFIRENKLQFDESNRLYSDISFVVPLLKAAKDSTWIVADSYYISRKHNDPVQYPALCQVKDNSRSAQFLQAYQEGVREGNDTLKQILGKQLFAYVLSSFPQGICGAIRKEYGQAIHDRIGNATWKELGFYNRRVLKMLGNGHTKPATILVKLKRAYRKKRGILGTSIQYYRFIDKVLFRRLKLKNNWVFIESFFGKSYSDSPKYLYEYLQKTRGDAYRYIYCLNGKSEDLKKVPGKVTTVKRFGLRYVYYTTRCKYQIYNIRQPQWLKKRKGMVFLETWHGTPLKKLVFDLEDIHAASQDHKEVFYKQSRDWDYLISANPFSTEIFQHAFLMDKDKILEYGYPRNDVLYHENRDEIAVEVKKELGIPMDKRVILYAPTWRDNQFYGKGKYKFSLAMDLKMMQEHFGKDSILLLRTHYHIVDQLRLEGFEGFVYNGSKYEDVSRLYLASDICITDYSSVFFDYANLRRPILFFAYDYEDYKDEIRGLYISMEDEMPGPILQTNEELVEALEHIDVITDQYKTRYDEFYNRFCSVDDGHACERTINHIFDEQN